MLQGGGWCQVLLAFAPLIQQNNLQKPALHITSRGFTNLQRGRGGCESKRRERKLQVGRRDRPALAQAVAPLPSATDVTARGMDRAPSDDRREERCVNALLYAVAVSVQPPALPRTAGPHIARFFVYIREESSGARSAGKVDQPCFCRTKTTASVKTP